ncbi:hypothetical protein B0T14DRAFT_571333 [Immersiella caudata]|uniref:Uncharacterized protein n=1 Tax=Immersiella caudata TaxID=314043 RepID=A0AA39TSR0_9PEZI|nr:hypothetical protein B0T14DRAFT_571333 [Immersiella caudata]
MRGALPASYFANLRRLGIEPKKKRAQCKTKVSGKRWELDDFDLPVVKKPAHIVDSADHYNGGTADEGDEENDPVSKDGPFDNGHLKKDLAFSAWCLYSNVVVLIFVVLAHRNGVVTTSSLRPQLSPRRDWSYHFFELSENEEPRILQPCT